MQLSTPIQQLSGVGPVFQKKLKKLGIKTVRDLLFHFPHRYEDFSNVVPISKIKINESCCIQGKILGIKNSRTWKKRMILTQAVIQDNSGAIQAIWFNQPYLLKVLKGGDSVYLSGKTSLGKEGLYLSNPAYEKVGGIVPVYPETEGLSSRWLRYIIKPLLINFSSYARQKAGYGGSAVAFGEGGKNIISDALPEKIRNQYGFLSLDQALWQIHFPGSLNLAKKAKERFSFEELFFIELWVLRERLRLAKERAMAIPLNLKLAQKFVKSLPFKLTDAQKKSAWAILKDLEKPRPMNRLLEGDVGSGKTVVATLAILNTIKAGHQATLMAPTEILARQHFKTIWELLRDFKINVGLLTGKTDKFFSKKLKNQEIEISRNKLLEKARNGEIDLVIGTHALISSSAPKGYGGQSKIKFKNLALVIIDEQHRFGVEQRADLCQRKEFIPHLLSMTATPIPRTLALTIYGDLDLSLIDQLPRGRKKILTKIIPPAERQKAYDFIRKEVEKDRQVFVICPRIEKSEIRNSKFETKGRDVLGWAEAKAVKEEHEKLSKNVFPDLKVGLLHGKMPSKEKERVMNNFKNKKIDILVSTSVVEVGVDVPNATVMMIEGAERFGLAQLYQFRGRVGRSHYQSYCFLFTDSSAKRTHQRLKAITACENGFELAEKDLAIRGPGDFQGTRQWGIPDLIMDSLKDIFLVEKTRQAAKEILTQDPGLKTYPLLQKRLENFQERIHLE